MALKLLFLRCIRILVSKITVSSFMLQISSNTFSTTLLFRLNSPFLLVPLSPGYIRVILCCNKASLSSNRQKKHILKQHVIGVLHFTQYWVWWGPAQRRARFPASVSRQHPCHFPYIQLVSLVNDRVFVAILAQLHSYCRCSLFTSHRRRHAATCRL